MTSVLKPLLVVLLLGAVAVAGCSGNSGKGSSDSLAKNAPDVEATSTTGGIRGVVVDEAIRPLKGVDIAIPEANKTTKTDETGLFAISGLEAGTYILRASSPLYGSIQQSATVVAGVSNPPPIKIQLTRVIPQTPYFNTLQFDGFIVCSLNTPVDISEECGEGVGSPRTTCDEPFVPPPCIANPIFPGQRVGHETGNHIQFDFTPDAGLASLVLEQVWTPTSDAAKSLYTPVGLNWTCTPNCDWDSLGELHGSSPTRLFLDQKHVAKVAPGMNVTMFTWSGNFDDSSQVVLNQKFTDYATISYYLPMPDDWSLVAESPAPF